MQIEFTNLLVSNPERQIQKRMEFLLDFLNLQKSASRMRLNLYGQPCRTSLRRRGTRGTRRPKTCMVETKVNINDASAQKFFSTKLTSPGSGKSKLKSTVKDQETKNFRKRKAK